MGSSSPRGVALQGGAHRLLAEKWRPGGEGDCRGEATPKELSETRSGRCREPWRRNLLVPLVRMEGERRERTCRPG